MMSPNQIDSRALSLLRTTMTFEWSHSSRQVDTRTVAPATRAACWIRMS